MVTQTARGPATASQSSVWSNPAFRTYWAGETISLLGSRVTDLALPLVALGLGASAFEVGAVAAARALPFVVLSVPLGIWADQRRKRPLLLLANAGRALLIGVIAALGANGRLDVGGLALLAAAVGVLTVLYEVAQFAFIPALVGPQHLVGANSALMASFSVSSTAGPGLGGALVQALGPATALFADAASFVVGATAVSATRVDEPRSSAPRPGLVMLLRDGARAGLGKPTLRRLAAVAGHWNLGVSAVTTVFVVYAIRVVQLSPAFLGMIFAAAGAGAVTGSITAPRIARSLGLGRTLVLTMTAGALGFGGWALARGDPLFVVLVAATAGFVGGFGFAGSSVQAISIRQTLTPPAQRSSANGVYRTATFGATPLGALVGGTLADSVGLDAALTICGLLVACSFVWILGSGASRARALGDVS